MRLILLVGLLCFSLASAQSFNFQDFFNQFFQNAGFPSQSPAEEGTSGDSGETTCPCGITNKRRIVNGETTQPNEYPWMLSMILTSSRDHFCGASILTERMAVTAAHCTHGQRRPMSVLAGAHDHRRLSSDVQESRIARVIEHENYSQTSRGVFNDIAILVLQTPLRFNTKVLPICMPVSRLNLENESAKLIGWGKLGINLPTSPTLQELDVRIHTASECRSTFQAFSPSTMVCSGNPSGTACMGDSGGPLLWLDPGINRYTLVGLVSYGIPGCEPTMPTVQTDVTAFVNWVRTKVQGQLCHKT